MLQGISAHHRAFQDGNPAIGKRQPAFSGQKAGSSGADEFILVTGGTGYIGSHFVNRYLSQKPANQKVIVVDNLSEGHRETVQTLKKRFPGRVIFRRMNVGDRRIQTLMGRYKVKAVVHYAASISVPKSQQDAEGYLENNVTQTRRLLDHLKSAGVNNFVFSSTAALYGNPAKVPIEETDPKEPVNNYGRSKLMVEQMLKMLNVSGRLNYIALRYFNAAGAAPEGHIGENHKDEGHLIPLLLQAALGKRPGMTLYAQGKNVRDFIHVDDLADAHIRALDYLERHPGTGEAFNLGTGTATSVMDVVREAESVMKEAGLEPHAGYLNVVSEARPGDPMSLQASSDKAHRMLGWQPQYGLRDILKTALNWELHKGNA